MLFERSTSNVNLPPLYFPNVVFMEFVGLMGPIVCLYNNQPLEKHGFPLGSEQGRTFVCSGSRQVINFSLEDFD